LRRVVVTLDWDDDWSDAAAEARAGVARARATRADGFATIAAGAKDGDRVNIVSFGDRYRVRRRALCARGGRERRG
jgi:hypothetical protein